MTSPSRAAFEKARKEIPLPKGLLIPGGHIGVEGMEEYLWALWQASAESLASKPGAWDPTSKAETLATWLDSLAANGEPVGTRGVNLKNIDRTSLRAAAEHLRHAPASYDDGWKAGILAAARLMGDITGEGSIKSAPGYCARGWKIGGGDCPKCGATDDQNCPGDLFDAEKIATAIRALLAPAGGEGER